MNRIFVTGGSGFIGTNLMENLMADRVQTLNFDSKPSRNSATEHLRKAGNILDGDALSAALKEFQPDSVVHLAARCDLRGTTLEDYSSNTTGVRNIIRAVKQVPSIERVIFASSRYVHRNEEKPGRDDEYSPFTKYGESKVEGEKIVRASGLEVPWLIVRPTSIWGPWFDVPYKVFFDVVRRGRYIHPRGEKIYKTFGYVGNVVHEIRRLLTAETATVQGRVFYVADYKPIEVREMAESIRTRFGAPPVRDVPLPVLTSLARIGDLAGKLGYDSPPLTSFRLNNIRTQMVYDMSRTSDAVGELPYAADEGLSRTVEWMKQYA